MTAQITSARVGAAHDGVAELIVTIGYDNGGTTEVTLDGPAGEALMTDCNANSLEDLQGQSWLKVRDALSVSYNRFQ